MRSGSVVHCVAFLLRCDLWDRMGVARLSPLSEHSEPRAVAACDLSVGWRRRQTLLVEQRKLRPAVGF